MSAGMKTVDNWMLEWYASAPFNQDQMFDFIVRIQRDATAPLHARVKELETGLGTMRKALEVVGLP